MAQLSAAPILFVGDTSAVHSSAKQTLGTKAVDTLGNQYIYLLGVASTGAGSWVTFDNAYATALLTANAIGPVAIAMAATVASTYGWYMVRGICTIAKTDTVAASKALYIDATDGRADDANVAGDMIVGALSLTADTTNVATVWISNPYVTDVLGS
jgi:hypothetical protein